MLVKIILSVFVFLFSVLTIFSLGTSVLARDLFLTRRIINPLHNVPSEETSDVKEDLKIINQKLRELQPPKEVEEKEKIRIAPLQEKIRTINQKLEDVVKIEENLKVPVLDKKRGEIQQSIIEKKREIDVAPLQREITRVDQKLGDIVNLEKALEAPILDEEREKAIIEWNQIIKDYEELMHRKRRGDEMLPDEEKSIKRRAYEVTKKLQMTAAEEVKKIESFEDPREKGIALEDIFKITEITVKETFIRDDGVEDIKSLIIRGTGLPNSVVVIFIYSTPIIVSTRTDANGNWSYVLERELEDGSHKIYVASVDNTGRILARSEPLPFVKRAIALEVNFPEPIRNEINAFDFLDKNIISIIIGLFVLVIILTIIFIGITLKEKKNL